MADASLPTTAETLIERLAVETRASARGALIAAVPALRTVAIVEALADEATRRGRIDLPAAARLAEAADAIAGGLGDAYAAGRAARSVGHVHALDGDWAAALGHYERALDRFAAAGRDVDAAITRSGALQTLIYLGRYADARDWADAARAVFTRHGDDLRLARLESNLGNVYYRQDRFEEALASYERALAAFTDPSASHDVAITLRNVAVCQISLQRFDAALATYAEARAWCERHGLVRLVAEVDYNIAYLHYLRGEYGRALDLYATARTRAGELDDRYHAALCDLDEAELHLELNLVPEGAALAQRAVTAFRGLGMRYEAAKATTTLAFAAAREGRPALALRRFDRARAAFVREENRQWPALIDLSKALVLEREGRPEEAARLCRGARAHFATTPLTARTAQCDLLLARLALGRRDTGGALAAVESAEALLRDVDAPMLRCEAHRLAGQIAEAAGDRAAARAAWLDAHAAIETLRSQLERDELKVAFLDDKQGVFAALADLALARGSDDGAAEAFTWVERAKSRSLAEQVALHADGAPGGADARGPAGDVQRLAQRLAGLVHQRRAEERRPDPDAARLGALEARARDCDAGLAAAIQALEQAGGHAAAALGPPIVALGDLQAALAPGTRLLQYADIRGTMHVWVVSRPAIAHATLGPSAEVRALVRLLHLQLAAATREGPAAAVAGAAVQAHLRTLGDRLLQPVEPHLAGASDVVILPHGVLHRVPFHACRTGAGLLADRLAVSYAPSASIHHHARRPRPQAPDAGLVLGVPDALAPAIADEAARLAARLPAAHVALGAGATRAVLVERAPRARILHIAAHGRFRSDNPAWSSVRLADGDVRVRDLARLTLAADLVTLSGCGTGLSVATGGDELLGLARALLYAGARAVLVSLWDVHDGTAVALMDAFYGRLAAGEETAAAWQATMAEVRRTRPDPFFWAPFVLVGGGAGAIFPVEAPAPSIFPDAAPASTG